MSRYFAWTGSGSHRTGLPRDWDKPGRRSVIIWPKWQHCQISQMPIYREASQLPRLLKSIQKLLAHWIIGDDRGTSVTYWHIMRRMKKGIRAMSITDRRPWYASPYHCPGDWKNGDLPGQRDNRDREDFLACLGQPLLETSTSCYAWTLLNNLRWHCSGDIGSQDSPCFTGEVRISQMSSARSGLRMLTPWTTNRCSPL